MTNNDSPIDCSKITTLIFDVDDTLYDVGNGFTAHRNSEVSFYSYIRNKTAFLFYFASACD